MMMASINSCAAAMARILSKSREHVAHYVRMSDVDPFPTLATVCYLLLRGSPIYLGRLVKRTVTRGEFIAPEYS